MRRNVRAALAAVAVLCTLGLAACGSDDAVGVSGGSDSSSDLCDYARELEAANVGDATSLTKADFDQFNQIIANVQEKAPDEIADDVDIVARGFTELREVFEQYDYDVAKIGAAIAADPELEEKLNSLGGEEFEAASQRVDDYFEDECGIAPEGS